ncbi:MAG: bifunctional D-glycero-beta-D-manno-heptose-7-phosphate kinase/D-glycero-beta-D-manno-heptose 1-phosphate adenylyltransferase HldE [Gammaproteobacteria bacterium]|nr:bifunctional D-glycero-beta-D-manno-heptose-7-phosphate kinase/D-glycero-beta-D-manno-heptose 1-phosphate adenylyltransferase HldE [Gammaproteobacteria bacterium]
MNLNFSNAHILVVGDVMLDSYWQGQTERISPEAPVAVVRVNDKSWRVGGSGNVAVNVTSLGARASLFAIMGDDDDGERLVGLLEASAIDNYCLIDASIPTTNKLRVLSKHQQLIRLDFEQIMHDLDVEPLVERFRTQLDSASMVVLSDYGKGLLGRAQPFVAAAKEAGVPVLVDPKSNNFEEFAGAYLLTPNQHEFEAVVGKWSDPSDLSSRAGRVIEQFDLQGLLITQGEQGMTLVMRDQPAEHFPAQAQEVYDVTGAGDTVIAALSTALGSGMNLHDSVFLACKAAAIVVGRLGTASASVEDLENLERASSNKLAPAVGKIVDHETLLQAVERFKRQGKKIVVTNGCFDLLHIGHIRYLEQASALGDVLVVAVNSDASVGRLKGADRPIHPLADRMELLAGLASVDLVTGFSEDTPEQLICSIEPDILVKGGDYEVDQIAGRQCAGEVVLIGYIDGKSSTDIVKKIQQSASDL